MIELLIQQRDTQRSMEKIPKNERHPFKKKLEKIEKLIKEFLERNPQFSSFSTPESLNGERARTQSDCNKAREKLEEFSRTEDRARQQIAEILRFFEPDEFCILFLQCVKRRFSLMQLKDRKKEDSRMEEEVYIWMVEHETETVIERFSQEDEKQRYIDRFWDLFRTDSLGDATEILEYLRTLFLPNDVYVKD